MYKLHRDAPATEVVATDLSGFQEPHHAILRILSESGGLGYTALVAEYWESVYDGLVFAPKVNGQIFAALNDLVGRGLVAVYDHSGYSEPVYTVSHV